MPKVGVVSTIVCEMFMTFFTAPFPRRASHDFSRRKTRETEGEKTIVLKLRSTRTVNFESLEFLAHFLLISNITKFLIFSESIIIRSK